MSRVRSKDTLPERTVRSLLHRMGYRFSLRRTDLPGKPDIVLPRHTAVIFVHGCFWHQHPGCPKAALPNTRRAFWREKLRANATRDRRVITELKTLGWRVIVAWECQVAKERDRLVKRIVNRIVKSPRSK